MTKQPELKFCIKCGWRAAAGNHCDCGDPFIDDPPYELPVDEPKPQRHSFGDWRLPEKVHIKGWDDIQELIGSK